VLESNLVVADIWFGRSKNTVYSSTIKICARGRSDLSAANRCSFSGSAVGDIVNAVGVKPELLDRDNKVGIWFTVDPSSEQSSSQVRPLYFLNGTGRYQIRVFIVIAMGENSF
jgi:hypothetical protein